MVLGLISGHYVGRDTAAVADRDSGLLRPRPYRSAVLTVRRGPPLGTSLACRCPAGVLGVSDHDLLELLAVLRAEVDLIVVSVQAEPTCPMLASWNRFIVVVTGECDGNLLCHFWPPFPCGKYIPPGPGQP